MSTFNNKKKLKYKSSLKDFDSDNTESTYKENNINSTNKKDNKLSEYNISNANLYVISELSSKKNLKKNEKENSLSNNKTMFNLDDFNKRNIREKSIEKENSIIKSKSNVSNKNSNTKIKSNMKTTHKLLEEDKSIRNKIKILNNQFYLRNEEKSKIENFLDLKNKKKLLYITGQPGTGKTSLVNNIVDKLNLTKTSTNKKESIFYLIININCYSIQKIDNVYIIFFEYIEKLFNSAIFNNANNSINLNNIMINRIEECKELKEIVECFLAKFKQLNAEGCKELMIKTLELLNTIKIIPLLVLDEIDGIHTGVIPSSSTNNNYKKSSNSLLKKVTKSELLYSELFKIPFISSTPIKIIMISNNNDFDSLLFRQISDTNIFDNKLVFSPYSSNDIISILKSLLDYNNLMFIIEDSAVDFLCKKVSKSSGDIRKSVNTLQDVLLSYINDKNIEVKDDLNQKINIGYILCKLNNKESMIINALKSLTHEQKIIIYAFYKAMIKDSERIDFKEKEIFSVYEEVKRSKFNVFEISYRIYSESLRALSENGIIDINKKGKNINYRLSRYNIKDFEEIFSDELLFHVINSD